ncbi:MAG: hypothetical protein E7241_00820 [Lachnospiraceae bacterium]|nr:hypothetical protein [Lachnospiraceae bacterium]
MKKRILGLVLCLVFVISAVGCGGSKTIPGSSKATDGSGASQSGAASGDYAFKSKDVTITINAEAKDILDKLGKALSTYESPSCAFGDLDVYYTYAGFEVVTYQEKKVDYIKEVTLKDDSVTTPEGVAIGDKVEKIESAYGKADSKTDTKITYKKDKMNLVFILKNGVVEEIQYLNARTK